MKRVICLFLGLTLCLELLLFLGGCNKTIENENNITINGIDISEFQIIRERTNRSWLIQEEIRKVQEFVSEKTDFSLPLQNDKDVDESEYEIHIGNTNRTANPSSEYSYDEWEISICDKKVYVSGGSTYAVQVAVTEFCELLEKLDLTDADSKKGSYSQTVDEYDSATYYSLKWQDEFDDEDTVVYDENGYATIKNWWVDPLEANNYKTDDGSKRRFGKSYLATDRDTVRWENGNLVLRAINMSDSTISYTEGGGSDGFIYKHQGGIWMKNMKYNKGYLEMRARIPDGRGVWTSFWCYDLNSKFEIDIFESLGKPQKIVPNIHIWQPEYNNLNGYVTSDSRAYYLPEGTFFDEYHTIGMLWDSRYIQFFIDGVMYYNYDTQIHNTDAQSNIHNHYVNIIAAFNVGWANRSEPGESVEFPLEYHIDYIRLYQIDRQIMVCNY